MVPPMTIPETATRVRTDRSRIGSPQISPTATTAPAPQASTTARPARSKPFSRRLAVQVATPNMTASTRTTKPGAANTPRSAAATIASCTAARTEATTTARRWPTRPIVRTAIAVPARTTRPMASRTSLLTAGRYWRLTREVSSSPGLHSAVDEAVLVGVDHDLHPVAQRQLGEDPGQVGFDRRLGQVQPGRDLPVRVPARDLAEDLPLPVGEIGQGAGLRTGRRPGT